jgi:dihydrofolate synthase/folylpolyglutamate synthase
MNLAAFLNSKPLFYDVIDYDRFPKAYQSIQYHLVIPKIIHLVGTNGKGSTGRFLATALHRSGKKVGHYTSPHIVAFNERIWMDGENVYDDVLEEAHQKLLMLLDGTVASQLSYFEYTTLLAMVVFENCEYVVLEAGMGGEFDATNVFPKILSIFTPIDFDHTSFLGSTIEEIASTKLRSMTTKALMGKQSHIESKIIARTIATDTNCTLLCIDGMASDSIKQKALHIAIKNGLSEYLRDNLELAMAGFEALGFDATQELFDQEALFGRLTRIAHNVTLDVGHNAQAAVAIVSSLLGQKITLVYNTYADKDYKEILTLLKPIIVDVEILDVDENRIVKRELLEGVLRELDIPYSTFERVRDEKNYLVFGSFSVAETFLKRINATTTTV